MAILNKSSLAYFFIVCSVSVLLVLSAESATAKSHAGVDTRDQDAAVTTTFYFAEGYTGDGFQEYLCLGNPEDVEASAAITYLYRDGGTDSGEATIPPYSRATVNVNAEAGAGKEVSIMVASQQSIVAERPMYFDYGGKWSGGHITVGATHPAFLWYFAEGYTGAGFEEWICVLNPNDAPADLTFYFQTQEDGLKIEGGLSVQPHSRGSFLVNDLLEGKPYQTSLTLASNQPVVAERPMYFDYAGGAGDRHWEGGHCVMGVPALAKEYYFAEGTTRAGFDEWLTIQNPSPVDITVNATYQLGEGQGDPVPASYDVPGNTRHTIFVPQEVGGGKDVSAHLYSSDFFLAERPMYFSYGGDGDNGWRGGHCVIGATVASREWFFAEGYTGAGFEEWLCIQNPSAEPAILDIEYFAQGAGALTGTNPTITVPPNTRLTIKVNDDAGPDLQISSLITSSADVVVERPMYFDFGGRAGGHDVVGFVR